MKLDLLLLPVPVVVSKQPQLGSSLASKGLPCVPASHMCLGPAVLLQCQGMRQEQGTGCGSPRWQKEMHLLPSRLGEARELISGD